MNDSPPSAPPPAKPAKPGAPEKKQRRALSHVGGEIRVVGGSEQDRERLTYALSVEADENATMAHVHGFHTYPARLHPETASRLVESFSPPGGRVLDPFCGSGTVLVEARLLGRQAFGIDANPLAVALASFKCGGATPEFAEALTTAAAAVVAHADMRRLQKLGPTRKYGAADREVYDAHVLLELDGLRDGIFKIPETEVRRALLLVLSAALTKVSKKVGDTAPRTAPKRLAGGFTIRFFETKAKDFAKRLLEYSALVPPSAPEARCAVGDARDLSQITPASLDLILSSPPYPGVYDYFDHHELRLRWLGMDETAFEAQEIGARRRLTGIGFQAALEKWEQEFGACLDAFREALAPQGSVALVIADSVLGGRALYADEAVRDLAIAHGLALACLGSQERPYFHEPTRAAFRASPRREHVLVLRHPSRKSFRNR
ncbi:MAG TPA: DNA methyltransferase [Polyangiaceae bacterium]|nr:DNA methyltransferase [Polyangiaceae bacterium]